MPRFLDHVERNWGTGQILGAFVHAPPTPAVLEQLGRYERTCALRDSLGREGITIRAGLHTGEIERRGDDIAGIGVHIGARIAGLAGPEEVLVSRTVHDLVEGSDLRFDDRGMQALKGVSSDWQVFAAI